MSEIFVLVSHAVVLLLVLAFLYALNGVAELL
jgi:hypothetical protein